jgi:hypothetical protein
MRIKSFLCQATENVYFVSTALSITVFITTVVENIQRSLAKRQNKAILFQSFNNGQGS